MDFATDEAVKRTFRVTFQSQEDLEHFEQIFAEVRLFNVCWMFLLFFYVTQGVTSAHEMEIDELKEAQSTGRLANDGPSEQKICMNDLYYLTSF